MNIVCPIGGSALKKPTVPESEAAFETGETENHNSTFKIITEEIKKCCYTNSKRAKSFRLESAVSTFWFVGLLSYSTL